MKNIYIYLYIDLRGVGARQRQGKRKEWKKKGEERRKKGRKSEKREKKKEGKVQVKPTTSTRPIDALIGDEEQKGKQKKEQKGRNREQVPSPVTMDHSVVSYDPQGSYGKPASLY